MPHSRHFMLLTSRRPGVSLPRMTLRKRIFVCMMESAMRMLRSSDVGRQSKSCWRLIQTSSQKRLSHRRMSTRHPRKLEGPRIGTLMTSILSNQMSARPDMSRPSLFRPKLMNSLRSEAELRQLGDAMTSRQAARSADLFGPRLTASVRLTKNLRSGYA